MGNITFNEKIFSFSTIPKKLVITNYLSYKFISGFIISAVSESCLCGFGAFI